MKFYAITIGEINPDRFSRAIQRGLTERHGVEVNWSHAAILVEDAGSMSGVWDSTGRGFAQCTLGEALDQGGCEIREQVQLNVVDHLGALGWLRAFRGTPYANAQYLLFTPKWMHRLARWLFPKFIRKFIRNGKWLSFCSESVAHFIRDNCIHSYTGIRAELDPELSVEACDEIDPFLVVPLAKRYRHPYDTA